MESNNTLLCLMCFQLKFISYPICDECLHGRINRNTEKGGGLQAYKSLVDVFCGNFTIVYNNKPIFSPNQYHIFAYYVSYYNQLDPATEEYALNIIIFNMLNNESFTSLYINPNFPYFDIFYITSKDRYYKVCEHVEKLYTEELNFRGKTSDRNVNTFTILSSRKFQQLSPIKTHTPNLYQLYETIFKKNNQ